MFTIKQFRSAAIFTLLIFSCFTLTMDYSFSQEENALLKAQGLYKQGNLIDAVKVLEAFAEKIKSNPSEKKRLAEAYYLLARIYYDASEDARVTEYMKQAIAAYADIGKEEGNLDFKVRLELVREEWLKSQVSKEETAPVLTKETIKTEVVQPLVQEKEKPVTQLKKKKKFPWLLVGAGVVVVGVLVYFLLIKKKKQILTLNVIVGEGISGNPSAGSYTYNKGDSVSYTYALLSNDYENLQVKLDENAVTASGNVTMNSNHTISVSATKKDATFENGALTVKGVRYDLASIPAGEFQMGSNVGWGEQPVHTVRISKGFWLGKIEVTQGLWQAVMGSNPSYFKNGDTYPVEQVSLDDCQSFITMLNQRLGGNAFRLPTEAEWEYACRAGTTGDRYGNLDTIAWYYSNSGDTTHPVGQKQANAWDLYDMLGNVAERCQDYYGPYTAGYQVDPTGPSTGPYRVFRGGSYNTNAADVRSAARNRDDPSIRFIDVGFRLARTNE